MAKGFERGGTPATAALERAGIAFTTHAYVHDPLATSYGLEASDALGLPAAQVFKTLLVDLDDGPARVAVAIVPVDRSLDLKALAAALVAKRARMAAADEAARLTGYVVGGISPIGQKRVLPTVLDASASAYDRIYVSGGRRGFDVGLAPADLLAVTAGTSAAIAR